MLSPFICSGFTHFELKKAGLSKGYARSIGITIDHRRTNHSEESLARNVDRLKDYVSRLVIYPLNPDRRRKGDAPAEEVFKSLKYKQNKSRVCSLRLSKFCYLPYLAERAGQKPPG